MSSPSASASYSSSRRTGSVFAELRKASSSPAKRERTGKIGLASQKRNYKGWFQISGDADARLNVKLRDREMKLSRPVRAGKSEPPALLDNAQPAIDHGGRAMLAPAAVS